MNQDEKFLDVPLMEQKQNTLNDLMIDIIKKLSSLLINNRDVLNFIMDGNYDIDEDQIKMILLNLHPF